MKLPTPDHARWLIADIGATNSRCAILGPGSNALTGLRIMRNEEYRSPLALLRAFLDGIEQAPEHCMLAVAAPVHGDTVAMVNRDWMFDRIELGNELGFPVTQILNDFHAIAWALPEFREQDRVEVGSAKKHQGGNLAVLGPGSGLGMSAWIGERDSGRAMTGEGGHLSQAGRNEKEDTIIQAFRSRYGHCSAERILSGPGLVALHDVLHGESMGRPEDITSATDNPRCNETLQHFFRFLGSAAAELALVTGAFGGVYIAGGIVPTCIDQLISSSFRQRFEDKNRYRDYMQRIPTYVLTEPQPGLRGLVARITARGESLSDSG